MIVLIFICIAFYNIAKRNKLNAIGWAVIGGASYFGGQLFALLLFSEIDQYSISNRGASIGISLAGGIVGALIAWLILNQAARKKKEEQSIEDPDLLDNEEYLEKL